MENAEDTNRKESDDAMDTDKQMDKNKQTVQVQNTALGPQCHRQAAAAQGPGAAESDDGDSRCDLPALPQSDPPGRAAGPTRSRA
eukprot:747099-Hanusia_phi.AAC.1